jgi:hypothetical protein
MMAQVREEDRLAAADVPRQPMTARATTLTVPIVAAPTSSSSSSTATSPGDTSHKRSVSDGGSSSVNMGAALAAVRKRLGGEQSTFVCLIFFVKNSFRAF